MCQFQIPPITLSQSDDVLRHEVSKLEKQTRLNLTSYFEKSFFCNEMLFVFIFIFLWKYEEA